MPRIDFADSDKEADQLVSYWASKIEALNATAVAGVTKKSVAKGKWSIELEVYVPQNSEAFKDFMRRFGR